MLPECFHRGAEISDGRWACSHPGLMAKSGVTESLCIECAASGRFCNKPPEVHHIAPREANRPAAKDFPCWRRGSILRQADCGCDLLPRNLDVYACKKHGECTIEAPGKPLMKEDGTGTVAKCFSCDDREEKPPEKLTLSCRLSPGDIMTLTAAVESLHTTYPGEYLTDIRTPCGAIWENNPHITAIPDDQGRRIEMEYPQINRSNSEAIPFIGAYTAFLAEQIGRPLKLTTNRPHLYLSELEKSWLNQVTEFAEKPIPFWLVNAGVKRDFTAKQWPVEHYQEVIDRTRGQIQWVQIGEKSHDHPDLTGVIDFRGKTDTRQLIRLAYHSQGGLGPVTFLQHIMAAWERPYICLLGGREPVPWVTYPRQHTLSMVGMLPCCKSGACWKSRVVPLRDGSDKDNSLCELPVLGINKPVGKCMAAITPNEVLAVLGRLS